MNRALAIDVVLLAWVVACGSEDGPTNGAAGSSQGDPSRPSGSSGALADGGPSANGGSSGTTAPPHDAGPDAAAPPDPDAPIPGAFTGTTYYVSPNGLDTQDGLSPATAWQTVEKVQSSSFGPGDAVLFEGGQSFSGCLKLVPNRVASTRAAPFTVGRYGAGNFTLVATDANCTQAAVQVAGINGFVLQGATVRGNGGKAAYGVWIYNATAAQTGGVTVRNCDVSGFWTTGSNFGGEIFVTSSNAQSGAMDDIQILRNVLHGASGPTSPDDNGISGYAHGNITNVRYEGNVVYDLGSHAGAPNGTAGNGILAIGLDGVVVQHNVVHHVGANTTTCGGPAGLWTAGVHAGLLQLNEVYAVGPTVKTTGCDWNGYDFDIGTTDSVMQYNYSHDNYGAGFLMYGTGSDDWGTNVVRYNLSENDGAGFALNLDPGRAVSLYNNTVYTGGPSTRVAQPVAFSIANHAPNVGLVANNVFVVSSAANGQSAILKTGGLDPAGLVFRHNDYFAASQPTIEWKGVKYTSVAAWQSAVHVDSETLSVDPAFVAPGGTGICGDAAACGAGYELTAGSPLSGTGVDLRAAPTSFDVGPRDFLGQPLPYPAGFNVGALPTAP